MTAIATNPAETRTLARALPLARRMIAHDPVRAGLTMAGVAAAVVLMLFLIALYDGIRTESNGYVADRPVAAWVAQDNTTNFIKSQSFVPGWLADSLRHVPGVAEVSPLVRLITLLDIGPNRVSTIVNGIDPGSTAGQPTIVAGSGRLAPREIILDRSLARRFHVAVGDTLLIQGRTFHVSGFSSGTNVVLTHLAFVTLADASELLGVPGWGSFLLVRADSGVAADELVRRLRARAPSWSVIGKEAFTENNMDELRGGLLPILATVAVLGVLDAAAVLALLLYGAVLERREDYAVLKALGASDRMLGWLIVRQSLAAVGGGFVAGVVVYVVLAPVVLRLVPQMLLTLTAQAVLVVAAGTLIAGLTGALWPLRRVASIHPGEVFRA